MCHSLKYLLLFLPFCANLTQAFDERDLYGEWYCKVGGGKDHYQINDDGRYTKGTSLHGKAIVHKGFWEIQGKTLHFARMEFISDGVTEKTNIVFSRKIVALNKNEIVLKHQGGLGNTVQTKCSRTDSWWPW